MIQNLLISTNIGIFGIIIKASIFKASILKASIFKVISSIVNLTLYLLTLGSLVVLGWLIFDIFDLGSQVIVYYDLGSSANTFAFAFAIELKTRWGK